MFQYNNDELRSIYELGRMYFEMGYFSPAERIFSGLVNVDSSVTPARLALGLVKLERGAYDDALTQLKLALNESPYPIQTKLALCGTFVASGEIPRARSLLNQMTRDHGPADSYEPELKALWEAFWLRCGA